MNYFTTIGDTDYDYANHPVSVQNSAPQSIHIGSGVNHASIDSLHAIGNNGRYPLNAEPPSTLVSNVRSEGYKIQISLGGKESKEIR